MPEMTHSELASRVLALVGPLWRTRGRLLYRGQWQDAREISPRELLHVARQMSPLPASQRSQWWRTHRAGRRNPGVIENPEPADLDRGVKMFLDFHKLPVNEIGTFAAGMKLPTNGYLLGPGKWITYRSGKWGKGTYEYIHDFGKGVRVVDFKEGGRAVAVPAKFRSVQTLVKLGDCLGYAARDGEDEIEAKTSGKKPELYCTPNGRALFVVENKRTVLAGMWGGKLGVEKRGIVG